MMIVGVAGGELAKREIASQVRVDSERVSYVCFTVAFLCAWHPRVLPSISFRVIFNNSFIHDASFHDASFHAQTHCTLLRTSIVQGL